MTAPYGPLRIGGVTLTCPWEIATKTTADDTRQLTLNGQEAVTTFNRDITQGQLRARVEALGGYANTVVPVTFDGFPHLDGWYTCGTPGWDESTWHGTTVLEWTLDLTLTGRAGEVDVESRLIGGNRVHTSSAAPELWHGVPAAADAYQAGNGAPGWVDRPAETGTVRVYRSFPAGTDPRWTVPAARAMDGAPTLTVAGDPVTGLTCMDVPWQWVMSNGIVRVQPRGNAGAFRVSAWNGSSWGTEKVFDLKRAGVSLGMPAHVSVARNDRCELITRLTYSHSGSRSIVDLVVKRGGRHVAVVAVQSSVAGPWRLDDNGVSGTANNQLTASGYSTTTSNDADGNRWVIGTPQSAAAVGGFGFEQSTPNRVLSAYIGVIKGGGSAVAGDAAVDINSQYLGTPTESERVIRR